MPVPKSLKKCHRPGNAFGNACGNALEMPGKYRCVPKIDFRIENSKKTLGKTRARESPSSLMISAKNLETHVAKSMLTAIFVWLLWPFVDLTLFGVCLSDVPPYTPDPPRCAQIQKKKQFGHLKTYLYPHFPE